MTAPASVELSVIHSGSLLVYSLRYAMGRQSYAPHEVANIAKWLLPSLALGDLATMARDLDKHLCHTPLAELPADIHNCWLELLSRIEAEIQGRS